MPARFVASRGSGSLSRDPELAIHLTAALNGSAGKPLEWMEVHIS